MGDQLVECLPFARASRKLEVLDANHRQTRQLGLDLDGDYGRAPRLRGLYPAAGLGT